MPPPHRPELDDFNEMSEAPKQRAWLNEILQPLRPAFREVVGIALFVNLLALATPVFILQVYDRVVFYSGLSTLQGLVIGMVVAVSFDFLLRQARSRLLQRVALNIDVEVGRRLFDKLVAVPLRQLEARPFAYWQTLFRDVDVVRNTFSGATAALVSDLPFAFLFIAFVFVIALPIAWVLLVMLPIFVLLAWRSAKALDVANAGEREAAYGRDGLVAEILAGRTTVKALGLEQALRPVWEDRHAATIERALERGGKSDTYVNIATGLAVLATVTLTSVGAMAIIDQRITIGALIAANMLSMRIVQPFQQLVGTWRNYATARQAMDRLGEAFAYPEDAQSGEIQLERPHGEIHLDDVTFRYGPDEPAAVEGIRLRIPTGGMHAIVGRNGSGKTTLLKLIQGLYRPESGRVLLDGADIAQFVRRQLVRWIGYVPQEGVLFAGTIRQNISLRQPDASDEEVLAAAKIAGVHNFILDLPQGYGTEIGEAGGRLSNGIRQRIVIARALIGNPPVLALDEPTSHLDRQAEEALCGTLLQLAQDHTILLVTHSPVLLAACNNVVALESGRVIQAGPAREVLPKLFPGRGSTPTLARGA